MPLTTTQKQTSFRGHSCNIVSKCLRNQLVSNCLQIVTADKECTDAACICRGAAGRAACAQQYVLSRWRCELMARQSKGHYQLTSQVGHVAGSFSAHASSAWRMWAAPECCACQVHKGHVGDLCSRAGHAQHVWRPLIECSSGELAHNGSVRRASATRKSATPCPLRYVIAPTACTPA